MGLRKKVEEKLEELIKQDVIEPVGGPIPWVSPIVIVAEPNGNVRLCVDMRCVNEAMERERHRIITVDEVLQCMSTSSKFTGLTLDIPSIGTTESRTAVIFVAHCRLFRYKRLSFRVNAASEIYQHKIHKILQGLPGVENISDDIIVHGLDEERYERPSKCLTRLDCTRLVPQ